MRSLHVCLSVRHGSNKLGYDVCRRMTPVDLYITYDARYYRRTRHHKHALAVNKKSNYMYNLAIVCVLKKNVSGKRGRHTSLQFYILAPCYARWFPDFIFMYNFFLSYVNLTVPLNIYFFNYYFLNNFKAMGFFNFFKLSQLITFYSVASFILFLNTWM